jgi:(1->4)-alpha-D-glucan 1-alpha-D-glucosylmutase
MLNEPIATYRVQINGDFDFGAVTAVVPYLKSLGIDFLYCSPCFQAAPDSTHGYDIVDYSRPNADWGGDSGFRQLLRALDDCEMRLMLDIVPNHMAISGRENPWWWDVLENGPSSSFASFFDVDWEPPEQSLRNIVLLPVLGDQYGIILEQGKLKVAFENGSFVIRYENHVFPVAPRSMRAILAAAAEICCNETLAALGDALGDLPSPASTDARRIARRQRDKRVLAASLTRLMREDGAVSSALACAIERLNADTEALHEFLEHQNYRLSCWKMASRDLGYRRFFDINSLAALRMENDKVFIEAHATVLKWVSEGSVAALRIDHPDGLLDPTVYFERLRAACPQTWIVAEKILAAGEMLRPEWPIDGTTGYDFLNLVSGLFVDPRSEATLGEVYQEFTGESTDYFSVARAKKQLAMRESLGSDLNRLTALFLSVCEADRQHRDYTRHDVHETLRAAIASFSVYRTYVREPDHVSPEDERIIAASMQSAKSQRPDIDPRLFDFLQMILLLRISSSDARELAMRFQQISAAVMAKGVEDTAFYTFNRFIALNEVGGNPAKFGVGLEEFMHRCRQIHEASPRTMLATSTHDTKRSEDVRVRLALLSEIPEDWGRAVRLWAELNAPGKSNGLPDRNLEYHLYQILVGAWPIERERLLAYAKKAAREAKVHTSWNGPNRQYEDALGAFINRLYDSTAMIAALEQFVSRLLEPGRINSLTQTLIKLTGPGVPDFYQGCELWNLSAVDPDNRRPVDFALRRQLLEELDRGLEPEQIMARADEGMPKLWLIRQGLELRARRPEWFGTEAQFGTIPRRGLKSEHIIAYSRAKSVAVIAPRCLITLRGDWAGAEVMLPDGEWVNHLTGERWQTGYLEAAALLRKFPVALLSRMVRA